MMVPALIGSYGIAAALGMCFVFNLSKQSTKTAKIQLWGKFWLYIFITVGQILLILFFKNAFVAFYGLICMLVVHELCAGNRCKMEQNWLFIGLYLLIFLGVIGFLRHSASDRLFFVFIIPVMFDAFAQLGGQTWGKRKIVAAISPNKTIGGVLSGTLAVIAMYIIIDFAAVSFWELLLLIAAGFTGDLLASAYKRLNGIKDFSALIPFHGGVLDRFDSALLCYATAYLIM